MGIRISEMEEATTFGADDYVPIVTSGTNKKALGTKIKNFIAGFFVSKSGDTMSGNLTVEKSNGEFVSKNPNVTINTTANNGVTSSQIEGVIVKDSANNDVTRFISVQETTGDVIAQISARNMTTGGTRVTNSFSVGVKKDGTKYYSIDNQTEFRKAINTTTVTISRYTGISSSVPLPAVQRSGNVIIIHFATELPAGTYTNIWTITPKPTLQQHAVVVLGSAIKTITVGSDGVVKFNNSQTISSATYVIGQIAYITSD